MTEPRPRVDHAQIEENSAPAKQGQTPQTEEEQPAGSVADWGPAEDWSDWFAAER